MKCWAAAVHSNPRLDSHCRITDNTDRCCGAHYPRGTGTQRSVGGEGQQPESRSHRQYAMATTLEQAAVCVPGRWGALRCRSARPGAAGSPASSRCAAAAQEQLPQNTALCLVAAAACLHRVQTSSPGTSSRLHVDTLGVVGPVEPPFECSQQHATQVLQIRSTSCNKCGRVRQSTKQNRQWAGASAMPLMLLPL